ncbi:hypothetical protein [Limosilactobacillus mucosae]|uniref:hypothetical protein n=1 Tax=Limosilactobacillus mucosae TaxID=97478 RepID=UPI000889BECF|nr:hypothetical protein [Limosilactobacillus mucosae]SDN52941.1 hypothetical protein SAMN05216430_10820 [Limosilactobacillus mucosae]SEL12140.1 hypothetical protein SAMN05216545_10981 [Limosilactobacillus mucosae]SFK24701.1 hypothetical protein SAMN05216461_10881 [Limosilactobacillus mucosae]
MKLADWLKAIIKEQKKTNQLLQQLISLENSDIKLDANKLINHLSESTSKSDKTSRTKRWQ